MTSPLTTGLVPHEASGSEVSHREFQSRLAGVSNLNGKKMTEAEKEKKLREACEGFESIFIQKMWQEMRSTLPKTNMLQGREEQYWQSMYDQELAKSMTAAGGIGLADMMYAQLSRDLVSASRGTASAKASSAPGFVPQVASIIPQEGQATGSAEGQNGSQGKAGHTAMRGNAPIPSVYDGIAPVQDVGESMQLQVMPGGTGSAEAALAAAGQPASQAPAIATPPEVEQALAALRSRKEAGVRQEGEQRAPNMNTGLNLARAAQFEAGSKVGARAVLPRTHLNGPAHSPSTLAGQAGSAQMGAAATGRVDQAVQTANAGQALDMQMRMAQSMGTPAAMQAAMQMGQPQQAGGQMMGQTTAQAAGQVSAQAQIQSGAQGVMQAGIPVPRPQQAAQPAGGVITPGPAVAAGQDAAQEPHIQKVRYTTNMPPSQRKTSGSDILHNLAVENAARSPQASQPAEGSALSAQTAAAQPVAAGHEAAQQPQLQKVRYTTNMPASQRKTSGSDLLRNRNVDAAGPNSRAGAGLAAYHAQQAGQPVLAAPGQPQTPAAAAQPAAAQSIQPLAQPMTGQPAAPIAPLTSSAAQAAQPVQQVQVPESYGIPPLTAMDLRR
ncbi:MAG: rod-binding protein [Desulfovibrio sp.]|uniref:rod-binding protein n=1 Tax=Desulfovibrio sp. TaxID=885 RepID=UPI0039E59509